LWAFSEPGFGEIRTIIRLGSFSKISIFFLKIFSIYPKLGSENFE
jgi:hypothetical protein